ncbi:MAG: hypothetical protein PHX34_02360 [Candidatus Shapirobacteria bacterium]|nr:hypothetical protein [Candidatus Shapirobacteria bacterium]
MVRYKLINQLREEINHYIGLPYSKNILKNGKIIKEVFMGGKGNAKEIALKTVEIANLQNIKLLDLSSQQIYNFQKKNKIGIDCSGLVCQLLIFYGNLINKKINLNIRKTSADMLTSTPLSKEIKNYNDIQTGDLIRQKNGHHVLFIIDQQGDIINYVDSSLSGRGVKYGQFNLTDKNFDNQGIYRLLFLN